MNPETKADLWVLFLEELQELKDLAAGLDFDSLDHLISTLTIVREDFDD